MVDDIFRTKVELRGSSFVTPDKNLSSLGSCFADLMGRKLEEAQFAIAVNPFGTLFHPYSLFEMLSPSTGLSPALYLESSGLVQHFRLPKTFYASDKASLQREWMRRHAELQDSLQGDSVLFLTLGTAFLYEREGEWVANCHQRPAAEFRKNLTPLEAMTSRWQKLFSELPGTLKIIVTVSPVRHLKDGLSENNLSKSLLRVLAEAMVASDPSRISYFPAYEILIDELRDYRFYAGDMLHPSPVATDYIWKVFQEHYLSEDARARVQSWEKLKARRDHRPLHPESEEYRSFQEQLAKDLKAWNETSPLTLSRRQRS